MLLDFMTEAPDVSITALVLENPARNPLAAFAQKHGIAVFERQNFAREAEGVANGRGGWLINVNSTFIIPVGVLAMFEGRCLNFHPGLLPEYAGLHTHQWAIRNGEREFGVTVHRMEQRIDTGAIVGQVRFPIKPDDTGLSLFSRCLSAGAELFARIIAQITRGEALTDIPQDLTRRRLYRHRDALDGRIDWSDGAIRIANFIRAGNYEPFTSPTYVARLDTVPGFEIEVLRATTERASAIDPGAVLEISAAGPLIACGDGNAIRIVKARNGRQVMSLAQWHDYVSHLPDRRLAGRRGQVEP
jgi:UDP-4-amino-4-deoxy-L-arabinose formyltransferase/UDP-glucuronic acid dehydrogenase (UDP-4-keto-hexauronic acid decarboxylating)